MKLFSLGRQRAVPFPQFRDWVRLYVRRRNPGAKLENTETGFVLTLEGAAIACNLRQLYAQYAKTPDDREPIVESWMRSLVTTVPDHTWVEARATLRPTLKSTDMIEQARLSMQRATEPDDLPAAPFVGDLSAIVMRELSSTLTGVTQRQLEAWGVTLEVAMREAVNNMNMMGFPPITRELLSGGPSKKRSSAERDVVGLVFEGDHLTATWMVIERFRDHLGMRLQGDYVFAVPNRNRLVAVRSDEAALLSQIQHSNRNFKSLPYGLTGQLFHVSAATTGGVVTVYQLNAAAGGATPELDPKSPFAAKPKPEAQPVFADSAPPKQAGRELNSYYGLSEPTGGLDMVAPVAPAKKTSRR